MKRLVNLITRNVRATDEKGILGRYIFAVLLVDTPEMGGRTLLDRLEGLCLRSGLDAKFDLKVYDPESFGGSGESEDCDSDVSDSEHHLDLANKSTESIPLAATGELRSTRTYEVNSGVLAVASDRHYRVDKPVASEFARSSLLNSVAKRSIDVSVASLGLVVSSPIMLAAMFAIRATSQGPALFTQVREGKGGKPFRIYKLRTMYTDAEARQAALRSLSERDGPAFKMKNDPRVTKVGRFLRSTCIDELPQLINVLKGDMSIVGPRPLPLAESRACAPWHRRRLDVRPGMTCHWQINKESAKTFDEWMRLDLAYVDRGGVIRDLWLMVQTLRVPMGGRGGD